MLGYIKLTMSKKSFKKPQETTERDESSGSPRAIKPIDDSRAERDWTEEPVEPLAAEPQVAAVAAAPEPVAEPPHLLTPLAVIWPATNLPLPEMEPGPTVPKEESKPASLSRTVNVTFVLLDLGAKQVSLSGDFNGWDARGIPMERDAAGNWTTTVALATGRYEYKFLVDQNWIPDPLARQQVWNVHGTLNSVIEVSA
jgi:hypothetical protein